MSTSSLMSCPPSARLVSISMLAKGVFDPQADGAENGADLGFQRVGFLLQLGIESADVLFQFLSMSACSRAASLLS